MKVFYDYLRGDLTYLMVIFVSAMVVQALLVNKCFLAFWATE